MTVSRETKLARYLDLLARWNATLNLTSAKAGCLAGFTMHVEDSLILTKYLPANLTRLIDLGSGQGFPAIPVAIMTGIRIEMIEADRRKAAFLTTALATLAIDGRVICDRIERADVRPADCVTARALAPMSKLMELARPFLSLEGCCLFLKGPAASDEILSAHLDGEFDATVLATASPRSNLVKITRLR